MSVQQPHKGHSSSAQVNICACWEWKHILVVVVTVFRNVSYNFKRFLLKNQILNPANLIKTEYSYKKWFWNRKLAIFWIYFDAMKKFLRILKISYNNVIWILPQETMEKYILIAVIRCGDTQSNLLTLVTNRILASQSTPQ